MPEKRIGPRTSGASGNVALGAQRWIPRLPPLPAQPGILGVFLILGLSEDEQVFVGCVAHLGHGFAIKATSARAMASPSLASFEGTGSSKP